MDQTAQVPNVKEKNQRLVAMFSVLVTLLVVGIIGTFVMIYLSDSTSQEGSNTTATTIPTNTNNQEYKPEERVTVPFDYEVTEVSETTIILSGDKGELQLPNDSTVVTLYAADKSALNLSDLQAGMRINLEMVPGESAWLYIVE